MGGLTSSSDWCSGSEDWSVRGRKLKRPGTRVGYSISSSVSGIRVLRQQILARIFKVTKAPNQSFAEIYVGVINGLDPWFRMAELSASVGVTGSI